MTFLAGGRLWLLAAIPLLVVAYVFLQRRRKTYAVRFTNLDLLAEIAPRRPGWRRHAAPAMLLATFALLVGTFARPAVWANVPKERSSVVLVLDVSYSMTATDLDPSRMDAAKTAARSFLDSLPEELRVGVVAFSDTAWIASPLTSDRVAAAAAIAGLEPRAGTAVGEGLSSALDTISDARADGDEVPAAVLLLSDGASNQGQPAEVVAQRAVSMEVPVYTVGIGTDDATITVGDREIPVDLDETELRAVASVTGGAYFRTADSETLAAVYRDLGSQLGYDRERREATAAGAGASAVMLLMAASAGMLWVQRVP